MQPITIIGAGILDVLAGPVSPEVLTYGTQAMELTKLSFGGDALNEAVALSRYGVKTRLLSKVGDDTAGEQVLAFLQKNQVDVSAVVVETGLTTGMNVVLVDEKGERVFLTNPHGSLRKLKNEDVLPYLGTAEGIFSFASLFVSYEMDLQQTKELFAAIKSVPNRRLVVDSKRPKQGESLDDLRPLLPYVDYFLPNAEEAMLLTGCSDPAENAKAFVEAGVSCAIVKTGKDGCVLCTKEGCQQISAYPVQRCIDTTGAGDCFAAGFLYGLARGYALQDCAKLGCASASSCVEVLGATEGIQSESMLLQRFSANCISSL